MGRVLNPIVSESYMRKYIEEHGGGSKKVVYIPEQTVTAQQTELEYIAELANVNIDINNPPNNIPLTIDDTTLVCYLAHYPSIDESSPVFGYQTFMPDDPVINYYADGKWEILLYDEDSHTVSSVLEPNGTRKLSVHFVNSSEAAINNINIRPTYDILLSPAVYIMTLEIEAGDSVNLDFLYEVFEIDGTPYYGNMCPWSSVVTGTDDLVNCTYTGGKIYITDITKDASITMYVAGGGR